MKNKSIQTGKSSLAVLLLILSVIITTLHRVDIVKAENTLCSLTLTGAEAGSRYHLYMVEDGDVADMTPTAAFAGADVDWNIESQDELYDLSLTLQAYVLSEQTAPDADAVADESGTVSFTGLSHGLYLMLGDETDTQIPSPVMAYLPYVSDDGELVENVTSVVKQEAKPQYTSIKVCKVWKNDTKSNRPEQITVALLDGSTIVETVALNAENNWQYTWHQLPKSSGYRVAEQNVPSGYTWSVTQDQGAFTITNTGKTPPETPPKTPSKEENPKKPKGHLPQTGQLWWPVLILTEIGILLIIMGFWFRKKKAQ